MQPVMRRSWSALWLLGLATLMFATIWPVMKLGLVDATPVWFAAGRAGCGAVASFALLAALSRLRLPGRRDLPIIASIGGLQLGLYFAMSLVALAHLPAGRSALLGYTTPLWIVPLAWPLLRERPRRADLLGLLAGTAGIAVLIGPVLLHRDLLLGHVLMLLASGTWALAILHTRSHRFALSPLELLPWQMLLAAVLLIALALWHEPHGGIGLSRDALLPLAYVGLIAGPVGTWASQTVANRLPASVTSVGFLVTPVLGLGLSNLLLGETFGLDLLLGSALILLGVGATLRR